MTKKLHTVIPVTLDAELVSAAGLMVTRLWGDHIGKFVLWARRNASDHWAYVPMRTYKRTASGETDSLALAFGGEMVSGFYVAFTEETDRLAASLQFNLDTHSDAMWPTNSDAILYLYK